MSDKVKRAKGTAHNACPCRRFVRGYKHAHLCCGNQHKDDPACCACCPRVEADEYYDCTEPVHAAIDSLILAVGEEVMEMAIGECDSVAASATHHPIVQGAAEGIAGRIRRLPLDDLVKP